MNSTLLLFASLLFIRVFSAFGEEKAYEGVVVMLNGEVVTGSFLFDEKKDLLYREKESGLEIFPPFRVKSFSFYDAHQNMNRQYIMLAVRNNGYPFQFYEVVVRGEVKVLRKRKEQDSPVKPGTEEEGFSRHHKENYSYYILLENKLTDIRQFAAEVYPVLKEKNKADLAKVIKEDDLNIHNAGTAISLIKLYNHSLGETKPDLLLF